MKSIAAILLFHFFLYSTGTFVVADWGQAKLTKTSCCKKMSSKHPSPAKCPKPSSGNERNNCYNCPLLYTATLTPAVTVALQSLLVKKEFSSLQNDELTDFTSAAWKPPDVL